jgi:DNA-binding LacI/PurR family transcriptional regulator
MFDYVNETLSGLRKKHPRLSETGLRNMHREELVRTVPSLASLITEHSATAIIGMNQKLAVNYYYWLKNVGISIPDDISLVSFDNIPILGPHPISSVDFRRNDLGYAAAHIFIRDVPVKADRRGNIDARPEFFDRGSLAPSRSPDVRLPRWRARA